MSTRKKRADPADYPALRDFLRAYLHEDYVVDYGTPEKALEAFLDDAAEPDVLALQVDVDRFLAVTHDLSIRKLRDLLSDFGSAWEPHDRQELERLLGRPTSVP